MSDATLTDLGTSLDEGGANPLPLGLTLVYSNGRLRTSARVSTTIQCSSPFGWLRGAQ